MNKRLLLIAGALSFALSLAAAPVSQQRIAQTAQAMALRLGFSRPVVPTEPADSARYRLFRGSDGRGFILIAADDRMCPLLGYSVDRSFDADSLPPVVRQWLRGYNRAIPETAQPPAEERTATPATSAIAPLITSRWSQYPLYNDSCPVAWSELDSCYERSVVGCVATATAQIMRYWGHPAQGRGRHSYYWGATRLSADFGRASYRWADMPDSLTPASTQAEVSAVAQLCYHVGVAVEMNYSPDGSGAYTVDWGYGYTSAATALPDYFHYRPTTCIYDYEHTYADWAAILRSELAAGRPVLYSGYDDEGQGGHAFIIDGADSLGLFHVNWGWGGYCDGYYALGGLNPAEESVARGYYFNSDNQAVIHIEPDTTEVGIEAIESPGIVIRAVGRRLYVSQDAETALPLTVSDAQGRIILTTVQAAPFGQYTLPGPGIYIVRAGRKSEKVVAM